MKRIFIPIATLLAGCAGGYLIGSTGPGIGRGQATMWAPVPINITETITVRDTLQIHVPGATMRVDPARTVTIPAQWATVHRDSDSLTVKAQTRVYSGDHPHGDDPATLIALGHRGDGRRDGHLARTGAGRNRRDHLPAMA